MLFVDVGGIVVFVVDAKRLTACLVLLVVVVVVVGALDPLAAVQV